MRASTATVDRTWGQGIAELVGLAEIAEGAEALQPAAIRREAFAAENAERLLFKMRPARVDRRGIELLDLAQHGLGEVMLEIGIEEPEGGEDARRGRDDDLLQ